MMKNLRIVDCDVHVRELPDELARHYFGIFRAGGRLHAYRNRCPHDGGPVCAARSPAPWHRAKTGWQPRWEREGEILYCPWHGSDFDLCTGRALSRKPLRLKSYPVRVENGTVTITV